MNQAPSLMLAIRGLDRQFQREVQSALRAKGFDDCKKNYGFVMHYMHIHEGQDVYQRDLEKHFHMNRSSITTIVQGMEKEGLITRTAVASDARLKRIVLTKKGQKFNQDIADTISALDKQLSGVLDSEEKEQFLAFCSKISRKLDSYESKEDRLC